MPESVEEDGAVRGPAPRGFSNVATFCPERDLMRQRSEGVGSGTAVKSAPISTTVEHSENVVVLKSDIENALRAKINTVDAMLIDAEKCQQQSEARMERACANLLIEGTRIPSLDQPVLSGTQETFLNASTATIISAEKIIILEAQRSRLESRLRDLTGVCGRAHTADTRRAA